MKKKYDVMKAVFFDVDGTLVSHTNNQVPDSTRKALDKLKNKGIKRVVATGRHITELERLPLKDIDFDGYITLNGQLCLDHKKVVVYENPIKSEEKKIFVDLFYQKNIPIMLVEKDRMYINFINRAVEEAQNAISTPLPSEEEYTGDDIYQVIVYVGKEEETAVRKQLKNCKITRWNPHAVDIVSKGTSKMAGIEQYIVNSNITKREIMAFGDGENDIEMLQYAGIGIAMGNAEDVVKRNADYITTHIDDNGVENALRYFKIIM